VLCTSQFDTLRLVSTPTPYALDVEPERRDVRRLSKKVRDEALRRMNDAGFGVRAIAKDAGLPSATVARIIRKQRDRPAPHPPAS
jgi:DNA invertase Pin-like site-specific DNA recombinase